VAVMNEQLVAGLNGQVKIHCALHDRFLCKQPTSCDTLCCVKQCTRKSRWLCQGGNIGPCPHGVCIAHGNDLLKTATVVDVQVNIFYFL
jgi:hypothetical protein